MFAHTWYSHDSLYLKQSSASLLFLQAFNFLQLSFFLRSFVSTLIYVMAVCVFLFLIFRYVRDIYYGVIYCGKL